MNSGTDPQRPGTPARPVPDASAEKTATARRLPDRRVRRREPKRRRGARREGRAGRSGLSRLSVPGRIGHSFQKRVASSSLELDAPAQLPHARTSALRSLRAGSRARISRHRPRGLRASRVMSRNAGPATSRWRAATRSAAPRRTGPRPAPAARGDRNATARSCSAGLITTGRAPTARTSARTARRAPGAVPASGVRIHRRPRNRSGFEAAKPEASRPAIGCPPTNRVSPRRARVRADPALDAAHVGQGRARARRARHLRQQAPVGPRRRRQHHDVRVRHREGDRSRRHRDGAGGQGLAQDTRAVVPDHAIPGRGQRAGQRSRPPARALRSPPRASSCRRPQDPLQDLRLAPRGGASPPPRSASRRPRPPRPGPGAA